MMFPKQSLLRVLRAIFNHGRRFGVPAGYLHHTHLRLRVHIIRVQPSVGFDHPGNNTHDPH